jgi:NTP pyrophosphatase (non-canonical NTP hydrolase)
MKPTDYLQGVLPHESKDFEQISGRMDDRMIRILHAAMGFTTESGEIVDQVKKHLYYGRPLDEVNLVEECGDLLWYMAVMLDTLGISFEKVMEINNKKLTLRYGSKFTEEAATNRDLPAERKVLEDEPTQP